MHVVLGMLRVGVWIATRSTPELKLRKERKGNGVKKRVHTSPVTVKDRVEGVALIAVGVIGNAELVFLMIPVALSASIASAVG
jgi:hypothetical protein